jgi:hypothetical protein
VIAGGLAWWVTLQRSDSPKQKLSGTGGPSGTLRVLLVPAKGNIRPGEPISVRSDVSDAVSGLGNAQCVMTWRDEVGGAIVRRDTTECNATFTEPAARKGVHRVSVRVVGTAGARGTASGSVEITASP